jgi:antitoxin StbD
VQDQATVLLAEGKTRAKFRVKEDSDMDTILTDFTVSISVFKKNPAKVLREAGDAPVAVLSHNRTAFYIVEPKVYENMIEDAWERNITPMIQDRMKRRDSAIEVDIDSL